MVVCIYDLPVLVRNEIESTKKTIKSILRHDYGDSVEVLVSGIDEKGRPFCKVSSYPKSIFKWVGTL